MDALEQKFEKEQKEFLSFLKSRYNLYHQSNVFFRDIHYGVMAYLEMNNIRTSYTGAEQLTNAIIAALEKKGILIPIDRQTFVLMYSEFKKAVAKKPAPAPAAKPLASAPAKPAAVTAVKPVSSAPSANESAT